ncbi:NnrS family protein [Pseudomaricurvus hydrocarbonicus]|uniref:NnrS family protein n=1 Tax=Pseudomaricurvus hydrocarbonicus TaxID=1470433 RepID=UPI001FB75CC7|nr:NnrS family protein [Aestuariicella hydrocarbonica]
MAFRPFFWLGALFSSISLTLWSAHYSLGMPLTPYGGSYFWHLHEMLFGFVTAIIVGFLLTAVQTWTKVPGLKGKPLIALVALWLLARLFMLLPHWLPAQLISTTDLLFLPLAAMFLARPIIKARLWRNLLFVPILLCMAALNGMMHASLTQPTSLSFTAVAHTMILLVALVMCIMGGRVFPMFTANGTHTARVAPWPWLEKLAILTTALCVLLSLQVVDVPATLKGSVFLLAGIANAARALRWRIWVTLQVPLVWSLHLSYWAVSLGLALLGLVELGIFSHTSAAYHAITVGGMGVMILSMMSRVSLGHTGRLIAANAWVTLSLLIIVLAFLMRVLAPLVFDAIAISILASGGLWAAAYGMFVIAYAPVLFSPRPDGAPG